MLDSCGERGSESGAMGRDAGDDGARAWKGAEGEGGALRGERQEPEEDLVSTELIDVLTAKKLLLKWPGRSGLGCGAATECKGG